MSRTDLRLAVVLLVLIALTHYGYDPLAQLFEDPDRSARRIFYALRGFEGTALFFIIGCVCRNFFVRCACLWGIWEESQTAVCQMARGFDGKTAYEAFQGLCGSEMYAFGLCLGFVLICTIDYAAGRPRGEPEG